MLLVWIDRVLESGVEQRLVALGPPAEAAAAHKHQGPTLRPLRMTTTGAMGARNIRNLDSVTAEDNLETQHDQIH